MKKAMAEKIKQPASGSEELKKFDALPVKKPSEEPKDVVSDFLEKATRADAEVREQETKRKQDPVVLAAHKDEPA